MGYELRGHQILSPGEYHQLARAMNQDAEAPTELVAWVSGERLSPQTLQRGFERAAVHVVDERGHELLSLAVRRINLALGRDEIDIDPLPPALPGEL